MRHQSGHLDTNLDTNRGTKLKPKHLYKSLCVYVYIYIYTSGTRFIYIYIQVAHVPNIVYIYKWYTNIHVYMNDIQTMTSRPAPRCCAKLCCAVYIYIYIYTCRLTMAVLCWPEIIYFKRKTTDSDRKFDIIDFNQYWYIYIYIYIHICIYMLVYKYTYIYIYLFFSRTQHMLRYFTPVAPGSREVCLHNSSSCTALVEEEPGCRTGGMAGAMNGWGLHLLLYIYVYN